VARRKGKRKAMGPELVGAVLDRAGEDRFSPIRAPVPMSTWIEVCGPRVAERARPIKLEHGVLVVRTATSAWAHELSLLSTDLLERLRRAGVAVTELRFRVGTVEPLPRPPGREVVKRIPPPAELPPSVASAVAQLDDEELRAAITEAARASLAFRQDDAPPKRR
jgi:hypothetical protein